MKDDTPYLKQMVDFINDIKQYTSQKTFDKFEDEDMLQDAVIRKLELIGEAANRLSTTFLEKYPDFPIREAVSMRNRLIHEYDSVNLEIVWNTVQQDIPIIERYLAKIL